MNEDIEKYEDIWGNQERYALLEVGPATGDAVIIIDLVTKGAVLIEDDVLYKDIILRMKNRGARRFDDLPW